MFLLSITLVVRYCLHTNNSAIRMPKNVVKNHSGLFTFFLGHFSHRYKTTRSSLHLCTFVSLSFNGT